MAGNTWKWVQIALGAAIVVASAALVRLFGQHTKRIHDRGGIDADDKRRTMWRVLGTASAIGLCLAVIVLGATSQPGGDSARVPTGIALLVVLLFAGVSGAVAVAQFLVSCKAASTWYRKRDDNSQGPSV
jgi:hypothetical protein